MPRLALLVLVSGLSLGVARGQAPKPPPSLFPPPVSSTAQPLAPPQPVQPRLPAGTTTPTLQPMGATAPERLTQFDPTSLQLHWSEGRWQVTAGGLVLKDFGRRESQAREALAILRDLGVNQHGVIGTPRPVMEYWLVDGQAPRGGSQARRLLEFNCNELWVEQVQGQWCVRDARQCLFNFGTHPEDAHQARAVIQRYGFNRVGHVGYPVPILVYFVRTADLDTPRALTPPELQAGRRPLHLGPDPQMPSAEVRQARQAELNQPGKNQLLLGVPFPPGRQLGVPEPLDGVAERVPIDWRQVQIRQSGGSWQLASGLYTIARFGTSEKDAQRALAAVQFYRLTEHCLVGGPEGSFSYFLASGQAPQGRMLGLSGRHFRPEALSVHKQGEEYVLADGAFPLFRFGPRQDEARQALQAIRKYRFDHVARIGGSDGGGMVILSRLR